MILFDLVFKRCFTWNIS